MTDQAFCKIETAISGEEIDKVEQLTHCSFTGRELKEYLEQAFVIHGIGTSLPIGTEVVANKEQRFITEYCNYNNNLAYRLNGTERTEIWLIEEFEEILE